MSRIGIQTRGGRIARSCGLLFALGIVLAVQQAPAALLYEGFEYTATTPSVRSRLIGKTNEDAGLTWHDPSAPGQPEATPPVAGFAALDPQLIVAGNLPFPGMADPRGNKFLLPRGLAATEAPGATTQSNIARIQLSGQPYNSGSLFFSFTAVLLNDGWKVLGNGNTGANAGSATNREGGFFAGFTPQLTPPTDGMSVATAFANELRVRRKLDSAGSQLFSPDNDYLYELGITKQAGASTAWATGSPLEVGNTVFVVAEYQFQTGAANDIVKLWVNPPVTPYLPAGTPSASTAVGSDVTGGFIRSFYFRSDQVSPSNFNVDELRIGRTYADVVVPEPGSAAMVILAMLGVGLVRRSLR